MNIHLNDEAVENDSDGRLINNMIRTRCWCCLGGRGSLPDLGWAVSAPESGERSQLTADGDQAETEIRMINVWSDPRSALPAELSISRYVFIIIFPAPEFSQKSEMRIKLLLIHVGSNSQKIIFSDNWLILI